MEGADIKIFGLECLPDDASLYQEIQDFRYSSKCLQDSSRFLQCIYYS